MQVVDATAVHFTQLLSRPLRQSDVNEWFLLSGGGRLKDILKMAELENTRAVLNDTGECIALWGLVRYAGLGHLGWMLASKEAEGSALRIHRKARHDLDLLAKRSGATKIAAMTIKTPDAAVKWHRVLGFEVALEGSFEGVPVIVYRKDYRWVP